MPYYATLLQEDSKASILIIWELLSEGSRGSSFHTLPLAVPTSPSRCSEIGSKVVSLNVGDIELEPGCLT